ncbi:MAG: preprotein translocase subunit SecG [Dysgonamonadaceae bacterium]|jgi:preprotein translocase subunit SecG|nr:preprotein translocase subunit SecG [Dysgonamonadaceae bacterium]
MYIFCSIVIVIVSILLVGIVVIQNSKGGGLAAGFASANQVMGVRKTTDSLEKLTWWFAGIIVAFCILATIFLPHHTVGGDSLIKDDIIETPVNQDANALPPAFDQVPAPAEEGAE